MGGREGREGGGGDWAPARVGVVSGVRGALAADSALAPAPDPW